MVSLKKQFGKIKKKAEEKAEEQVVDLSKTFYKKIKKQCRGRNDPIGMKMCDEVLKAIDKRDVEAISEAQAIIGGHLQFKKAERNQVRIDNIKKKVNIFDKK